MKRLLLSLFLTSIAFSLFAALPCNGAVHHGLAIGLTSNETIQQIKASDFFISLDPNCNEIVGISFSPTDINDTHKTVDCSNLSSQIINIFITDIDGNQVSVETYFHVTDEINTCGGGSSASCQSNLTIKEGLAIALSNTNEATLHVNNCIKKEEENCLEDYVVQFDATNETEIHFDNPSLGIQTIDINLAFNNYPLNQIRTNLEIQLPLSTSNCIPVPIVYRGLATTLDNSGSAELDVALFDTGSYSDCGGEVVLSFSESIIDTLRTFYCANLGVESLDIWITDTQTGTKNKVETYVFVQGTQEICTDCPQALFLSSQAEVNAFGINHPTCDTIPGDVHIFGADITDLSPLANIEVIEGNLAIYNCTNLTSLYDLTNLAQVNESISIANNPLLDEVGFPNFSTVIGPVNIENNPVLSSLYGFHQIYNLKNLSISNNPQMTGFYGLHNLSVIEGNLIIQSMNGLTDLNGLGQLEFTNGIYIENCSNLTSLYGINKVYAIYEALSISDNPLLSDITGLTYTQLGSAYIVNNPQLTNCSIYSICNLISCGTATITVSNNSNNCNSVEEIQTYCPENACCPAELYLYSQADVNAFPINWPGCTIITGNVHIASADITDLSPLANITTIGGSLVVYDCANLSSLSGLTNLNQVDDFISIANNAALTEVGFQNLSTFKGVLSIGDNLVLNSLSGFDQVTLLKNVSIYNNPLLHNFHGLHNLLSIDNQLAIQSMDGLSELDGLNQLQHMSGLYIENCSNLISLNGLNQIYGVYGELNIADNPLLTDITSLTYGQMAKLSILNNPQLANCSIYSICNLINCGNSEITVFGNSNNCNSIPEIEANCPENACCPQDLFVYSQADVDAFATNWPNCSTITGNVHIAGANITDLSPLGSITYIGGSLTIVECAALTTLEALNNLTQVDDNISIYNNQLLANCSVSILCSYLANGGSIHFSNNATGCNSSEEVMVSPNIVPNLTPRMIGEAINLTLTAQDLDNGSFGACGSMVHLSISQTSFSCQDVGTKQLLITATDDYGNMSEMLVDLEITDPENYCICDGMTLSSNDQPLNEGAFLAMETIESEAIIDISKKVVYHAGESIVLTPGFHAKAGSDFTIQIGTCVSPGGLTTTTPSDATSHKIGISPNLSPLHEAFSLNVSPNPFQGTATMRYTLPHPSKISLALYDINGRLVEQLAQNIQKDIGQHNYHYQAQHLGEGMYFLVLQSEQESLVKKIAILK